MAQLITGIDIGQVSLSAATVRRHGAAVELIAHATVNRYAANGSKKPLSTALAELAQSCPFKGKVVLAASQLAVLIRLIGTIPMAADRLERLLRLELAQHADERGDLAADYVEVPLLSGDEVIQCCCIGQVGPMKEFLSELASADCKPDRVQAPALALGNLLSLNEQDDGDEFGLLADIGAKNTRLVLRRGTAVLAAREVNLGGEDFTEALAKGREIHFQRAEELKRSQAFAPPPQERSLGHEASVTPSASAPPRESTAQDDEQDALDLGDDDVDWLNLDESPADEAEAKDADDLFAEDNSADSVEDSIFQPTTEPTTAAEDDLFAATEAEIRSERTTDFDNASEDGTSSEEIWLRSDTPNENPSPELASPGRGTMHIGRIDLGPELSGAAEALAGQISASLAWFRSQLKLKSLEISHVELCGGGALLQGLPAYLSRRLRAPVTIWQTPRSLQGAEGASPPPLALALALSGGAQCPDLDIRPESLRYQHIWRQQVLWYWVSAAAILCAAILFSIGHLWDRGYYNAEIAAYQNHQQRYRQEQSKLAALRERREDLAQDVRGITSRIFAGRDLLYVIRSLKQAAEDHQDLWVAEFRTESVAGEAEKIVSAETTNRGRNNRTQRGANREKSNKHNDTSIDRGKLYVRVVIRRDDSRGAQAYERIFRDWLSEVMEWKRPDNEQPLFRDYQQTEVPSENDQFEYEVRFDFLPTNLRAELQ